MTYSPPRLLIIHLAGALGGAERTSALLLRYLHKTNTAVVTAVGSALLKPVLSPYCECYIDGNALGLKFWFSNLTALRYDINIAAGIIKDIKPDIVLGMMHYGAALAVLGGRRSKLPLRTIASFRGPLYEYLIRYEPNVWQRLFLRIAVGITGRAADRVLVPSAGTGYELTRRFWIPSRHIQVIPNGIDMESVTQALQEEAADLATLPPNKPVILAIARLSAEKDLGLLIEAFGIIYQQHKSVLLIVGDGPEREALEAKAERLGIRDAIYFVGYRANVFPYLVCSDVFIHTCQFEGFGYTMLEAMACGVPVVATDCPYGPREVIEHGQNGILTNPGDPAALAMAVLSLLHNPELRHQLSLGAKARAASLSVESMMASYGTMLNNVVASIP